MTEFRIVRWLGFVTLPCALAAQSVTPSPSELIEKALAAEKAQEARGNQYTYHEDQTTWQLDKNGKRGKPSTEAYDHIMLEGSEYKKLVLVDGKPLPPKKQKQVDDEMERERMFRKKNGRGPHEVDIGGPEVLEKLFDNKVTGEESVGDRKAWRMESEPKADVKPENKKEAQTIASRRVVWFDEESGAVIRQSNEFVHTVDIFGQGSTTDILMMRIGDDWVIGDGYERAEMKILPGIHGGTESHQHFYDYKRFSVDSEFTPQ